MDLYNRVERLNKQHRSIAMSIDSQNSEIQIIEAKIESQGKRHDDHDKKIIQTEGRQTSLAEQTNTTC